MHKSRGWPGNFTPLRVPGQADLITAVLVASKLKGFTATIAHAQRTADCPSKPIRIIVPYAASGIPEAGRA